MTPAASSLGLATARAAAEALLERALVRSPDDIHVARMAASLGAYVVYGPTGTADARSVRSGRTALIRVDENARGTPRARWSAAHELGHVLLHDASADAIVRVHAGVEITGLGHKLEREADVFAAHLLLPERLVEPWCGHDAPAFEDVDALGEAFGTSRTATARRYAELARAACAFVECREGRVARVTRSRTFRGEAFRRRAVEEGSLVARALRGEAVGAEPRRVTGAWGAERLATRGVEMTEQVAAVPEAGVVLAWLWHAAAPAA